MKEFPLHILLIDAESDETDWLQQKLHDEFSDIHIRRVVDAETSAQAIGEGKFNVVITDCQVSWGNINEMIRAIKLTAPDVLAMMFTNRGNEQIAVEAMKAGFDDYIIKSPDRFTQLSAAIECYRRRRHQRRRASQYAAEGGIEHRQAQQDLQHITEQLSLLLETLPVACYTCKAEGDFAIKFVSSNVLTLTGYQPEDLIEDSSFWKERVHPDDAPQVFEAFPRLLETGHHEHEYRLRIADGSYRRFSDSTRLIRSPDGIISHITGMWQDVTRRQQDEDKLHESHLQLESALTELREVQQQVVQQERLRSLGEMACGIAHEFNNVLSPILGYSEILTHSLKSLSENQKTLHYATMINTAAKDAKHVVRRLREFYRHRADNETAEPIDLNQLVESTVALTMPRWKDMSHAEGKSITVETQFQRIRPIAGCEVELREVLTNLIFNGVDAMPHGGKITIRTRSEDEYVLVEVSDNGIGMTEKVRKHCLDPFFTTKGKEGTGLGLSMVYGIVRRHGGDVAINSKLGVGTTFHISLPVWTKSTGVVADDVVDTALGRNLHVLLVDDSPSVCEMMTEYLLNNGHTVETADNGREALEKFWEGYFDLVLTDLALPEINGEQLASYVKQLSPNKPVIMLTGFDHIGADPTKKPRDVDVLLTKPVEMRAFQEALVEVMRDS